LGYLTVNSNPDIVKYGVGISGFVMLPIVMFIAIKAVMWFVREVVSTYRSIKRRVLSAYGWLMRRPTMKRMKGKFMAKWKNGYMADRFEDAIFQAQMDGILSDQEGKILRKKTAVATGISDLAPRFWSKQYLIRYFKGGKDKKGNDLPPIYQKLAGPAKSIPGPKPGENNQPTNVVNSAMLDKIRAKKAQAA